MKLLLIVLILSIYFVLWCMLKMAAISDNKDNNILDKND